jgi:hypothetical protein
LDELDGPDAGFVVGGEAKENRANLTKSKPSNPDEVADGNGGEADVAAAEPENAWGDGVITRRLSIPTEGGRFLLNEEDGGGNADVEEL